jgi:hypothetical protein
LCLPLGTAGWLTLGALLLGAGLLAEPVVRWALRGQARRMGDAVANTGR